MYDSPDIPAITDQLMMIDLSTKDYKEINDINHDLLGCHTLDEFRIAAMESLRRIMDADTSVFFSVIDSEESLKIDHGVAYGADDAVLNNYHNHYKDLDPFLSRALNDKYSRHAPVLVSNRLVNYNSFERTEFYNDFFRPISVHSVLGLTLRSDTKSIGLLAVHRPRNARPFNKFDQTRALLAVPVLSTALQRVMALEQVYERDCILENLLQEIQCEGVMVLDPGLKAVFCDARARELLNVTPGKPLNSIHIPEAVVRSCKILMEEHKESGNSNTSRIDLNLHGTNILGARVRLASTDTRSVRFIVCLENKQQSLANYHKLKALGLTRREIDIAQQVGLGKTSTQIANNLCISERTVENHLRSIYTKLGVHNRTSMLYHLITDN